MALAIFITVGSTTFIIYIVVLIEMLIKRNSVIF